MSFDFNIFEEEGKDTKFIQKAIDAYHPATKFELSVKLRGMSSHCINVSILYDKNRTLSPCMRTNVVINFVRSRPYIYI